MNKFIEIKGRILYLTEDISLIERQLCGEDIDWNPSIPLMDNISTDEITPSWVCLYYDERLGDYAYVGLRGNVVRKGSIKNNAFEVLVSGTNKGCGSSREMAPKGEKYGGIKIIVAKSIEKIYEQNCENIGLLTSTDIGIIDFIKKRKKIPLEVFLKDKDQITKEIILYGGLSNFNKERLKNKIYFLPPKTKKIPKTLVEKIIIKHLKKENLKKNIRVSDSFFIKPDVLLLHDFTSPMTFDIYKKELREFPIRKDIPIYTFSDHLTFMEDVVVDKSLCPLINELKKENERVARENKTIHYGNKAICHIAMIEDVVLPGMIVAGCDSHTSTAGGLSSFSFGIGCTEMANVLISGDVKIKFPQTIRIELKGKLKKWVSAKDVILYILAMDFIKRGEGIGRVFEFTGEGISSISVEERTAITNMVVEGGGWTGIFEGDEKLINFLQRKRNLKNIESKKFILKSDKDAQYEKVIEIDLSLISPMVALPYDPKNSIPLRELKEDVRINIAYGGSCTGGKISDINQYAKIIKRCLQIGLKCHPDVKFYIQFGSSRVKEYAHRKGIVKLFKEFGAILLNPGCGACIGGGEGISRNKDDVTISAINRNYPGRSGAGKVYLSNPYIVALSSATGKITSPVEFFK